MDLDDHITTHYVDITDFDKLNQVISSINPNIIIHMAAQTIVNKGYIDPLNTWKTNVLGTQNLLEVVRNTESVEVVINVTSDKCYENKEWDYSYRENDQLGGYDPYSSSKAASEILTASYKRSFFNNSKVQIATVRSGNVIGGGEFSYGIIYNAYESSITDKVLNIFNPQSTRPWQHVLESINAYLILVDNMLNNKGYDQVYNIGPDISSNITLLELIDNLKMKLPSIKYIISEEKIHEAKLLMIDSSYARRKLNWKSKLSIKDTLQMIADWYVHYTNDRTTIKDFTYKQIEEFFNKN